MSFNESTDIIQFDDILSLAVKTTKISTTKNVNINQ